MRCHSSISGHWINQWGWWRAKTPNFLCQLRHLVLSSHAALCAQTTLPFPPTQVSFLRLPPKQGHQTNAFCPTGSLPLLGSLHHRAVCHWYWWDGRQASPPVSKLSWGVIDLGESTEQGGTPHVYKTRLIHTFVQEWWKSMAFNDELSQFNLKTVETQKGFGPQSLK